MGNPETSRETQGESMHLERVAQSFQNPFHDLDDPLLVWLRVEDDPELVASEAPERIRFPERLFEAWTDQAQQRVAGAVPERVVELLEVIQVKHQHRYRGVGEMGDGDRFAGAPHEQSPVGKRRELVGSRLSASLGKALDIPKRDCEANDRCGQGENRQSERQRVEPLHAVVQKQGKCEHREPGWHDHDRPASEFRRVPVGLPLPGRKSQQRDREEIEEGGHAAGLSCPARNLRAVDAVGDSQQQKASAQQAPGAVDAPPA